MLSGMTNHNMRRRGRWTFFTFVEMFVILITLTSGEPVPRCSMQHASCTISIAEGDCEDTTFHKENSLDLNTQNELTANMETNLNETARYLHLSWRYKPKTTGVYNDTYAIHLSYSNHRRTCYTLTLNYPGDHGRIILTPQQKPREQTIHVALDITEETEYVPSRADFLHVIFYHGGSEYKTSEILLSGLTGSSRVAFFVKWEGPSSLKMKFIRYADDIEGVTLVITMFYTDYFEDVLSTETLCLDGTGMMLMKEYGKTLAVHSCVHSVEIAVTTDGRKYNSTLTVSATTTHDDNGIPCPANSSTSTCEKKTTSTAIESTTHTPEGNTSPGLETTVRDLKNTNLGIGTTAPTVRNKENTNLGLTATPISPHDPKMIAGAVIGGVGGILAIAMLLVLFLYRKGRDFFKLCIDHYRAPDAENPEPIPGVADPPTEFTENPTHVWPRCLIVYVEEEPPDSHHNVMTRDLAEILTSYFNIDIITCKNVEPHAHINQMYEESDKVTLVIIIAYRPTGDLRPGWSITWNKPPRDQPNNMATVTADAVVSVTFGCCPTAISHPLNDSNVKPGRHFDIYNNEKSIAALHDFMTENIASPKTSQDRQEFNAKILHMIDNCPNTPGSDCSSNFGTENLFDQINNINRSFDNL